VQPGELVAVLMPKGWEQVVAVLGVLYAGGAYVPLERQWPAERIGLLLKEAGVRQVLVAAGDEEARVLACGAGIEWLEVTEELGRHQPVWEALPETAEGQLAYVIYTSGSTGVPKGVMIGHGAALNTLRDINERFAVSRADRVLGVSALNFDLSVYDVFGVLGAGGTLVLPQGEKEKDPQHWVELVAEHGVSLWNSVPALAQLYVERLELQASPGANRLRVMLLSGDWIALDLPQRVRQQMPSAAVVSLGGATEGSIWSICYPIEQVQEGWKSIPYGRALSGQSMYVLGEGLSQKPPHVVGELYIGGAGVAQGYWKDEKKTAERFIEHPVSGERLYRTGDLGRYFSDGVIEFLGREDTQVKIQGHRIELGEIEAVLQKLPQLQEAVVSVWGEGMQRRLVGYVVPARAESLAAAADADAAVVRDPLQRAAFKLEQRGLRRFEAGSAEIMLPGIEQRDLVLTQTAEPLSGSRNRRALSVHQWGEWLGHLRQMPVEGHLLPKRHYPSAGSLYPIHTYCYLNEDVVSDVARGFYYYDPQAHRLVAVGAAQSDEKERALRSLSDVDVMIFLVADTAAMRPL
jgi:amino acid adenylation domain-containing protein